uniref:Uncharacterized protein n=1 Tax=Setaria italica TaxID=4555 RepID=K3YE50_SETIT
MGSIMRGIQALKDGLIWRVGNGEQIILTRKNPQYIVLGKNFLKFFWEEDQKNILVIPVRYETEDPPTWHFDTKGVFSVKSAYHA